MPQNDVFRLTINATANQSVLMETIAVRQKSTVDSTPAERQTLADDFKELFRGGQYQTTIYTTWALRQLWGAGMTIDQPRCVRIGGVQYGGALTGTLTGAVVSGDALPPQCAAVHTITTGFIGRRKRGRIYQHSLGENDQSSGLLSSSFLTNQGTRIGVFFGKYFAGGTSTVFEVGVWSERTASGCVYRGDPPVHTNIDTPHPELAYTPSNGATLRSIVYTQRRRTLGVGM